MFKDITDAIADAIFNGIPVLFDYNGIENFFVSDVLSLFIFDEERISDETKKYRDFVKEKEISRNDLETEIVTFLRVLVSIGIFSKEVTLRGRGETFDPFYNPLPVALEIRKRFIVGDFNETDFGKNY